MEQQEIDSIYAKYEAAYRADEKVDDGIPEETIRRAKKYLLRNYDMWINFAV